MKVTPQAISPVSPAPVARIARDQGALLSVAAPALVSLALGRCALRIPDVALPLGASLLVLAAGVPVLAGGPMLERRVVPNVLPRMLAFHDHAAGVERPPPDDLRRPATLLVTQSVWDESACRHWLLQQLIACQPEFHACARLWARSEIYQVVRFVLAHTHLTVQALAERYGLSNAQFRRVCLRAFGRPLKEQLRLLRATRALQMHADTGASFTQVAADTGFSSPSHFCCDIKSLLGHPPSAIFDSVRRP